ncbi:hypothetical protein BGX38DRAFT_1327400 [Terfezia claveryi]|nr:hypothetical protein BGX38DRAFT_1327400 [Terfezia claveryi]
MTFVGTDVEEIFDDRAFREGADYFAGNLNLTGIAWVNDFSPIPPTTSPALSPPPISKPMTNSVSTNTDHPVPTYAEAATGQKQLVKPQKGKGKGKEPAAASPPPPPP